VVQEIKPVESFSLLFLKYAIIMNSIMAQEFQTSFIPTGKQTSTSSGMIPGGSFGAKKDILGTILFLVTLVIFIITALYTGYSVWYEKKLATEIDQLKVELAEIKKSVVDGEIDAVEKMNNRLKQSADLLSSHLAPMLLFGILEDETLPTVTFSTFLFEADGQNYQITAAGQAANFESIVYQSDVFGETPAFRDVLFSNLQRTPEGNVTFSFSTFLTEESIRYLSRDFSVLDREEAEISEDPDQAATVSEEEGEIAEDQVQQADVSDLNAIDDTAPAVTRTTSGQNSNLNES